MGCGCVSCPGKRTGEESKNEAKVRPVGPAVGACVDVYCAFLSPSGEWNVIIGISRHFKRLKN